MTTDDNHNNSARAFSRRRVIVVRHRGNLANKMIQYMGALTLAKRINNCTIVNVSLPEWGIEIPDDTTDDLFFDNIDLWTWDAFRPHINEVCLLANRSESIRIMMADHLQRMEFLDSPQVYQSIFPYTSPARIIDESDLLINIRTAEILQGVAHYPLLPIDFYEGLVALTGLNPVFVGQLGDSKYVRQLRLRFPKAVFYDSQGARADFDLIRSAKNIVVAVSTFSWLAAWLSRAQTVFLPLSGFYNPAHHREIDLLPVDDIRYRYFLFPLNYGLPEEQSLEYHQRISGRWKEISRNQVALLKTAAPFLRVPRENYDNGLPTRTAQGSAVAFDSVWYAHQYIDAAMEISEGWFEDPLHHYLEVGRLRGYKPVRQVDSAKRIDLNLINLALHKRATQSTVSQWSNGRTVEEDAGYAVNGNPAKAMGFHTDSVGNPWWMVDLEDSCQVSAIRIFNRDRVPELIQRRASPLNIELSRDGNQWDLLHATAPGQIFGGYSSGNPLIWSSDTPVEARYVRISIPRAEYLHLSEVEVFGHTRRSSGTADSLKKGIICDVSWLSTYLADEHFYLLRLLNKKFDFVIIDSSQTDFNDEEVIEYLNSFSCLLIAYPGYVDIPLSLIKPYKIFKVDDLVSYNSRHDALYSSLIADSDMIISPYAYEFGTHFDHHSVVWVPYSSSLEGCAGQERVVFNRDPIKKVLVSGSLASDRPFRQYAASLSGDKIAVLEHPGYDGKYDNEGDAIVRTRYYEELSKYLCCFCDGHTYRYVHLKNFEIASVGSLLLTDRLIEKEMNELGFVDRETCIFADKEDFLQKVAWILSEENRPEVDRIRHAGMELVRERHMTRHRALQINNLVNSCLANIGFEGSAVLSTNSHSTKSD